MRIYFLFIGGALMATLRWLRRVALWAWEALH